MDGRKVGALATVAALVLCTGLPAFAAQPDRSIDHSAAYTIQQDDAQAVAVPADAKLNKVSRDAYAVKSGAEVRAEFAASSAAEQAASHAARLSALQAMSKQPGDDYPWPYAFTDDEGGGLSPIGYYYRECVDFVAWRLNRDAGATPTSLKFAWKDLTPQGGDARQWKQNWEAHGWEVSKYPEPGWVAWWGSNHVAYVNAVHEDGTVSVEEYNLGNRGFYSTRTIPAASVDAFLAPPK